MSTVPLHDQAGKAVGEIEINSAWLERERGAQALHELVVAIRAHHRAGTASTKTRGNVRGGGKKPWRQKGTGRARAGSNRSPLWRGGGTTFGPLPRKYTHKVNKKVRLLAMRRAFTETLDAGKFRLLQELPVADAKTSALRNLLDTLGCARSVLIIAPDATNTKLRTATRNLAKVELVTASTVNVYQLLRHHHIVLSQGALDVLGQRLA
jgi:large subunit ribosomal protein L4